MDFFDVIEKRQSVRKYAAKPVEQHKLDVILAAANRAPSAGNFQSYEIYVIRSKEGRAKLAAATFDQGFIADAAVLLVFCTNPSRCEYDVAETCALEDATIACTFAMLAATALGLSSCWIGALDPRKVAQIVHCPNGVVPISILTIAYPRESPERTTRRSLNDLVHAV